MVGFGDRTFVQVRKMMYPDKIVGYFFLICGGFAIGWILGIGMGIALAERQIKRYSFFYTYPIPPVFSCKIQSLNSLMAETHIK